jgi:ketosteroid isomerase-like protein
MKALAALAILLPVAACQAPPAEMTEAERAQYEAEVEQAINARWDDYASMYAELDAETWLSFWTPDTRLFQPGLTLSGEEFPAFAADFFGGGGQTFALDVESFEVFVHGDVAYQIGQYDDSFQFPGEEPALAQNYFFARWEKVDGTWKIDRFLTAPRDALEEG